MSLLAEIENDLRKSMFDQVIGAGRPVRYVPRVGAPKTLTAVVEYAGDAVEGGLVAAVQEQALVHVFVSDVPAPRYQDTFEFDGRSWVIVERNKTGNTLWILTVQAMMER